MNLKVGEQREARSPGASKPSAASARAGGAAAAHGAASYGSAPRGMSRTSWKLLSIFADAVALNAAIIIAFVARFGWPIPAFNFDAYERIFIPLTLAQIFIFFVLDLYDPTAQKSGPETLGSVIKGVLLGVLVLATAGFFLRAFSFPRSVIVLAFLFQVLLVWGWRLLAARVLHVRWPERRVLLVGSFGDSLEMLDRYGHLERWGYRVCAIVCDDCTGEKPVEDEVAVLDGVRDLPTHIKGCSPDQIVVTTPSQHREVLEEITLSGVFDGEILVVPQLYELHLGEVNFSLLGDVPLLRLTRPARPVWQQGVKQVVERVLATVLLLLLSPVILLASLAVLVFSGRPVFYKQERLGLGRRPFTLYKFRTMIRQAEKEGAVFASTGDPRVTRVGRLLRNARLDELPQLYNVFKGEMSLVGPRPERPEFVSSFVAEDPLYAERFRVRPGITGLAQVAANYSTTAPIKLRFDLMYIHHQSLALDLRIVLRTLQVVLTGKGAA